MDALYFPALSGCDAYRRKAITGKRHFGTTIQKTSCHFGTIMLGCSYLKNYDYVKYWEKYNMPISKEKERVSARIPIQTYQILIHAAEISGATLNQFLVQAAVEKAQMIIEKDQTINLSIKSANVFFNAIENPPKPSKKLKDAMKAYRESFSSLFRIIL